MGHSGCQADIPGPIRIPEPPGGFPPGRKPKKSEQKRQSRLGARLARLPVASLVIVIIITAVQQH